MARSTYIYLLYDERTKQLIGAFTVKHEMETARTTYAHPTWYKRMYDGIIDPSGGLVRYLQ